MAGGYAGICDFDPDTADIDSHQSNGEEDCYLSKFDSDGEFLWACTWGGDSAIKADYCRDVAADPTGNSWAVGEFRNTVDFNPDPTEIEEHTSGDAAYIFLLKYLPNGYWNM